MKKIFTLLILLAAFFAMPRSAQAAVEWEVSDGTQWRINPENPGSETVRGSVQQFDDQPNRCKRQGNPFRGGVALVLVLFIGLRSFTSF